MRFDLHCHTTASDGVLSPADLVIPAEVSPKLLRRMQRVAAATFTAMGCEGLARVDLFVTPAGEVVLNEVNTIPGLTRYSRFPEMMKASGRALADVLDGLIRTAAAGQDR